MGIKSFPHFSSQRSPALLEDAPGGLRAAGPHAEMAAKQSGRKQPSVPGRFVRCVLQSQPEGIKNIGNSIPKASFVPLNSYHLRMSPNSSRNFRPESASSTEVVSSRNTRPTLQRRAALCCMEAVLLKCQRREKKHVCKVSSHSRISRFGQPVLVLALPFIKECSEEDFLTRETASPLVLKTASFALLEQPRSSWGPRGQPEHAY